jgi:Na+-driven multidrug efflux pump
MLGVVTAMETFCGQAHGARRYALVGVVLQRALAISLAYCAAAVLLWTRGAALLARMGQDPEIAAAAGAFTLALGPALVLDAADQCCRCASFGCGVIVAVFLHTKTHANTNHPLITTTTTTTNATKTPAATCRRRPWCSL